MVVENLKVFTVKSYKELYKYYKDGKLGITDNRMPENLAPLKPSNTLTELECIQSLLEVDEDNIYHVAFDGKKYIITYLGFSISKIIDGTKQLIQFGEDGIWQEEAELKDGVKEEDLDWQDSSNGTLEMWGMNHVVKKHEKQNLKQFFKGKTLYINGGEQLEEFREILRETNLSVRMGYDETYKDDKEVNTGYIHFESNKFFLSKNSFFKKEISFNDLFRLTGIKYEDVKRKEFN